MTQIKFDFGHPSADGIADLAGETVTVPPTDNTFAYEVTVGDSADSWRFIRVVQVPDSANVLDFADLVEVDSDTLIPSQTGNPLADIDQSDVDWAVSAINA